MLSTMNSLVIPVNGTVITERISSPISPRQPSRTHIDLHDKGLRSIAGAQVVVACLRKARTIKNLILGHNPLGDEGVEHILEYLCTDAGRKLPIEEISLNVTWIGDKGLDAVSKYLEGNRYLTGLHIQNNLLQGEPQTVLRFVKALNTSHLHALNLTNNTGLSDAFLSNFLPQLTTPHLRELKLSCLSLTPASGHVIAAYLSSPASLPLQVLKLNGNQLNLDSIASIHKVVEKRNYSLICLELYSNRVEQEGPRSSHYDAIAKCLVRNSDFAKCTRQEALALLPIARLLLPNRAQLPQSGPTPEFLPLALSKKSSGSLKSRTTPSIWHTIPDTSFTSNSYFAFRALPTELQLQILSHLAPSLSSAQRARVYNWASSPLTLPSLKLGLAFPSLHSGPCITDPTATMMAGMSCSGDPKTCLGPGKSLICGREEKRMWWLTQVGCERFELDSKDLPPPSPQCG